MRRTAALGHVIIGVGASGYGAERHVAAALVALRQHRHFTVCGSSDLLPNPAVGGATLSRFVNAAVVITTPLSLSSLVMSLHGIEQQLGRVRSEKNGGRAADLDVLWAFFAPYGSEWPQVPHPRMWQRRFALLPALQACTAAGLPKPLPLVAALQALPP